MEDRSKKINKESLHQQKINITHQTKVIKSPKFFSHSITKINNILGKHSKPKILKAFNKVIDNCQKYGLITSEEKKMVKNIINIEDLKVDDVMTPRTDIIAVHFDANIEEVKQLIIDREHSRIPVYKRNLDSIVGFIHSKDLAKFIGSDAGNFKISNVLRKILYVPHSMRIGDLLLKMRSSRVHIAIVLDEYGGTDGLVTIEDIVEEIVGEIDDEYDIPDDNIYLRIRKIGNNILQVGGRVEIDKIADFLGGTLTEENYDTDFDTVGGLIFALFKKVPEVGETLHHSSNIEFKILEADARSVKLVEITKLEENPE